MKRKHFPMHFMKLLPDTKTRQRQHNKNNNNKNINQYTLNLGTNSL